MPHKLSSSPLKNVSIRKKTHGIAHSFLGALTFLLLLLMPLRLQAQIVTDGTMGPPISLSGPDAVIPQSLGTLEGSNLFHSFRTFAIPSGESATFTGSDDIANVISRVTGGEVSYIDGLLRSEVGRADFFFINPSGVVLGPNAEVHVPASFHVSTAHELRFQDGSVFSAAAPGSSTLTQAPPTAFGFLGTQRAGIEINGSVLEFAPGAMVSISGGDIAMRGEFGKRSSVYSPQGAIEMTAVGDESMVIPLDDTAWPQAVGQLVMDKAHLCVSGDGGGYIALNAGSALIRGNSIVESDNTGSREALEGIRMTIADRLEISDGSEIGSDVYGDGQGGVVWVSVGGTMQVSESDVSSSTFARGHAGDVLIEAGELVLESTTVGDRSTFVGGLAREESQGNAGTVSIFVDGLTRISNGSIVSSSTFARGNAGDILVFTGELLIDGMGNNQITGIIGRAETGSEGSAGSVHIIADGAIQILDGAVISSSTFARGNAGSVFVLSNKLMVDGKGSELLSGIVSAAQSGSQGHAGKVDIAVDGPMQLFDGAVITSSTFADGDAGEVWVRAGELLIDGMGSGKFTGIASQAEKNSQGRAFIIRIVVDGLTHLRNGAVITSSTFAQGHAGGVIVQTGDLILEGTKKGYADIAGVAGADSQGDAGLVLIMAEGQVRLVDGARILSSTAAKGDAGDVVITASELTLDSSEIAGAATSTSTGHAGGITIIVESLSLNNSSISIEADQTLPIERSADRSQGDIFIHTSKKSAVSLDQQSRISTTSTGNAPAGHIVLQSKDIHVGGNSSITTSALQADGGAITLRGGTIFLHDGLITTSVDGPAGNGGDITISGMHSEIPADFLIMKHGFIQANTSAVGAVGGNIGLHVRRIIDDRSSGALVVDALDRLDYRADPSLNVIQAAAPGGTRGQINVGDASLLDISGSIIPMRSRLIDPLELSTDPCDVDPGLAKPSSLVIEKTRGGPSGMGCSHATPLDRARLDRLMEQAP